MSAGTTFEQRVAAEEAKLAVYDEQSRHARARRSVELDVLMAQIHPMAIGMVSGGLESSTLRLEALAAYRAGFGAVSIVALHAACERELAGWVRSLGADAPKGWTRWGLGALVAYAAKVDYLPTDVTGALAVLNERRRLLYHLQVDELSESIWSRAAVGKAHKDEVSEALPSLLLDDARDGIRAMFALLDALAYA